MKLKRNLSKQILTALICCYLATACTVKKDNGPGFSSDSIATLNTSNWTLLPFEKVDSVNPILMPGTSTFTCPILKKPVRWDEKDVFNPAAVMHQGKVYLIFRAEDTIGKYAGTSRLGLAASDDGLHFTRLPAPVFYPDNDSLKRYEWGGGVEDPRIVKSESGDYIMTYTGYDGTTARLLVASSTDLIHWTKHGTVLQGWHKNTWSKSGAIVASLKDTSPSTNNASTATPPHQAVVATRINGTYWMYFGDTDLFMATSDDLMHWTPLEEKGQLKSVLKPRPEYFDSRLVS